LYRTSGRAFSFAGQAAESGGSLADINLPRDAIVLQDLIFVFNFDGRRRHSFSMVAWILWFQARVKQV
jgi:hypothetical protein